MKYYQSTLTHQQHQTQKEFRMKNLAKKIASLSKSDYDKEILSLEDIGKQISPNAAKSLELCNKFGIRADITASEIVHSKKELEALKNETVSFRDEGANDENISQLKELVTELEAILQGNFAHAQRLQTMEDRQTSFDKAVADIEPLCDQLKTIEKALKEKFAKVREIETSDLPNPLNPAIFRLANAMSTPSGVFN